MNLGEAQLDVNHFSHDAEFAQSLMSGICGQHRLETTHRNRINFEYEGVRLPHRKMAIGMIGYGEPVEINISNLKSYSLSLPISGQQTLNIRGAHYHSDHQHGVIVSNIDHQDLIINKACKKLQVVIPEESMSQVLAELLNTSIVDPIIFNPQMDLKSAQIVDIWWQNIKNFLLLRSSFSNASGLQMLSDDYESFIIKSLLLSQENNYSARLQAASERNVPEHIVCVRDFMIQHAQDEISIEQLYHLAGVSKSKLYEDFQHIYHLSPMAYLKKYRLKQLYKILNKATAAQAISISRLAFDWGFTHLGRFSKEYKDEFGENPSETLKK